MNVKGTIYINKNDIIFINMENYMFTLSNKKYILKKENYKNTSNFKIKKYCLIKIDDLNNYLKLKKLYITLLKSVKYLKLENEYNSVLICNYIDNLTSHRNKITNYILDLYEIRK